jgi:hypothetical protein
VQQHQLATSTVLLALALRARLQDLVTAMVFAAQHRTDTQFDHPVSLYENGTPMWSIVVRSDVAKQRKRLNEKRRLKSGENAKNVPTCKQMVTRTRANLKDRSSKNTPTKSQHQKPMPTPTPALSPTLPKSTARLPITPAPETATNTNTGSPPSP